VDPVGFCFEAQGVRIGLATDLGYIPESVKYHLRQVDLLMLESNHDIEMLKVGPYPRSVKPRVLSRVGHLSNILTSEYLTEELDSCTAHVILGHLSEANNHPEIAREAAERALTLRNIETRIWVAEQNQPSAVFQF